MRTAVNGNNSGVLAVFICVVWHIDKSRNLPFAVLAGVMHQKRLNHVFAAKSSDQRMGYLQRLLCCKVKSPEIIGSIGPFMAVEQPRAVMAERAVPGFGATQ